MKKKLIHVGGNFNWYLHQYTGGNIFIKLSTIIMGIANIRYGQIVKGIGYLCLQMAFLTYMVSTGAASLVNLVTLGTRQQEMVYNKETAIFDVMKGDNSMRMLLSGVVAIFVIAFFVVVWISSIKSGIQVFNLRRDKKKIPRIKDDILGLFDSNIHRLMLFIPLTGLLLFTVVPLIYMILMAFTNYDVNHQPPGNLFEWIGLNNFKLLLMSGDALAKTFWPVLGWTIVWAFFATFSNYFGGMLLAILINKKDIRFKKVWRTVFVLTIAIPSFVGLLVLRTMLNKAGTINIMLENMGFITDPLPFLTNATWARVSVIIVNIWLGIPFTMLITTGILTNIPADLYESAKIDGASALKTFLRITFPYMFYVTTPYLISNFISNVNNFNPIFFLTGGGPETLEYFKGAGKTDLLVTWLYKLTSVSKDYSYAATIGIIIFIISASLSLIIYRRSGAYKDEEGFQ